MQEIQDNELGPLSHTGYQRKHAALHAMGRYSEAFDAFRTMLSILEQSPHSHIRELRNQYVNPTATIQEVVEETIPAHATCAHSTLLRAVSTTKHGKLQLLRSCQSTMSYGLQ
ncbi:hypothetical protein HD554DRAFT_2220333 [Boletus coccyginus]|nr:hypothetical protein HD554DRAFT_2220333 [Boletus coccyginus]